MKLNFNFPLKGLDDKPLKEGSKVITAGLVLSNMLSIQNKGNSVKLFDWALKIYREESIEIDDSDADVLLALIENSESLTVISKVPMINYIKSVKEKKK